MFKYVLNEVDDIMYLKQGLIPFSVQVAIFRQILNTRGDQFKASQLSFPKNFAPICLIRTRAVIVSVFSQLQMGKIIPKSKSL